MIRDYWFRVIVPIWSFPEVSNRWPLKRLRNPLEKRRIGTWHWQVVCLLVYAANVHISWLIYIYICMYIYVYTYMYICMYLHTNIHTYIQIYIHTYIHTNIYIQIYIYVYSPMRSMIVTSHNWVYMYVYIHLLFNIIYLQLNIRIHTHINIHICRHTCILTVDVDDSNLPQLSLYAGGYCYFSKQRFVCYYFKVSNF
jgi:hypothetical protein